MAFPAGWTRKAPLVIQHGKVTANQTALPVLLMAACLPGEMLTLGGPNAAQSDGGDIRFSSDSAGASQLPCEIVAWTQNATPANAIVEIWVPVNVLAAADVTIYVWYNAGGGQVQPAASAAGGSQAVWDVNYVAVHHFGNGTTLAINDSTSNGNDLTNNDPAYTSAVAGRAGAGACNFVAAATQRLYRNSPSNFPIGTSVFSMECWANHVFHDDGMIGWGDWPGGTAIIMSLVSGNMGVTNTGGAWMRFLFTDVDNWHHFTFTLPSGTDVTNIVMYMDGAVQTSNAPVVGSNSRTGTQWRVSGLPNITSFSNVYNGFLDEVRVSKVARSATWISTSYNVQNSPGAFTIAGPAGSSDGSGGGGGGGGTPLHHLQCAVCGFCLDTANMDIALFIAAKHTAGWGPAHMVTISQQGLGTLTLLEQHTASSSATLDFTSWYSSSYDDYMIEFIDVLPATNAADLVLRLSSNGGSSYDSSALYDRAYHQSWVNSSNAGGDSAQTGFTVVGGIINTASYNGVRASMRLWNPGSGNYTPVDWFAGFWSNALASVVKGNFTGLYRNAVAVNAFRLLFSSGNIASGIVRIYGVPKS